MPSAIKTPTAVAQSEPAFEWQMAISYPATLDALFGGAPRFAERVSALTHDNLKITTHPPGELAPGTGVLDVVLHFSLSRRERDGVRGAQSHNRSGYPFDSWSKIIF